MSYLLTEVAMEMLGWRFYDANGVARQINFDGSGACEEDVENLSVSLGIAPQNNRIGTEVVQAEADSSSHIATNKINLFDAIGLPQNHDNIKSNHNNNADAEQTQQSDNANEHCSHELIESSIETSQIDGPNTSASKMPLMLKIQHVQGGYDATKAEETEASAKTKTQQKPFSILGPNHPTTSTKTYPNERFRTVALKKPKGVSAFIDLTEGLEIGKQLHTEIDKVTTDMNRHKNIFFDAVPDVLKYPTETFLKVMESYRTHEFKNLETELLGLKALRKDIEKKTYIDYKHIYTKYITTCEKLFAHEQLNSSKVTVQEIKNTQAIAKKKTSPLNQF